MTSKRLRVEGDEFFVARPGDSYENEHQIENFVHKSDPAEAILKYLPSRIFSDAERKAIQKIVGENADSLNGFVSLLQLFTNKWNEQFEKKPQTANHNDMQISSDNKSLTAGTKRLTIPELSFSKPRKKLDLEIYTNLIRLYQPSSGKVEMECTVDSIIRVVCVPIPPKQKGQSAIIIFFAPSTTATPTKGKKNTTTEDAIVFTVTDEAKTNIQVLDSSIKLEGDSLKSNIMWIFSKFLEKNVIQPSTSAYAFKSSKQEDFVTAYIGSKDGQLYFLDDGILFGVKQPILFLEISEIDSIEAASSSRTSFGLSVKSRSGNLFEFDMIDEAERQSVASWISFNKRKMRGGKKEEKTVTTSTATTKTINTNVEPVAVVNDTNVTLAPKIETEGLEFVRQVVNPTTINQKTEKRVLRERRNQPSKMEYVDENTSEEEDENFDDSEDEEDDQVNDKEEEEGSEEDMTLADEAKALADDQ